MFGSDSRPADPVCDMCACGSDVSQLRVNSAAIETGAMCSQVRVGR